MESTKERICNLFQDLVVVLSPFQKLQMNCVSVFGNWRPGLGKEQETNPHQQMDELCKCCQKQPAALKCNKIDLERYNEKAFEVTCVYHDIHQTGEKESMQPPERKLTQDSSWMLAAWHLRRKMLKSLAEVWGEKVLLGWSPALSCCALLQLLPFFLPDVRVILSQFLDVLLDPVFSLLSNDIGDVTYSRKEPAGVWALWARSCSRTFVGMFLSPLRGTCLAREQPQWDLAPNLTFCKTQWVELWLSWKSQPNII